MFESKTRTRTLVSDQSGLETSTSVLAATHRPPYKFDDWLID